MVKDAKSYAESVSIKKAPLNASTISSCPPSGKFSSSLKKSSFHGACKILIFPAYACDDTGRALVTLSCVALNVFTL